MKSIFLLLISVYYVYRITGDSDDGLGIGSLDVHLENCFTPSCQLLHALTYSYSGSVVHCIIKHCTGKDSSW